MLYYRTYYNNDYKPWVTLIHGVGANSSIWDKQLWEYKKHFNVLLIDLRGHGQSPKNVWEKEDTFLQIANEVIEVLDHIHIKKTHFVGISSGTIVIQTIAQKYPERIQSMVLGGAITKLNFHTKCLVTMGNLVKYIVPYMWIYRLAAWIMMPKKNHVESRQKLVEEAKKMGRSEFIQWVSLNKSINPFLKKMQKDFLGIPTLFVMGEEDYLFKDDVEMVVLTTDDTSLEFIERAGHLCNIDQSIIFNKVSVDFIIKNSGMILPLKG